MTEGAREDQLPEKEETGRVGIHNRAGIGTFPNFRGCGSEHNEY